MSLDANKTKAIAIVEGVAAGTLDKPAFTADAIWWMQGRGEMTIDLFLAMHRDLAAKLLAGESRMLIHGITAEGDRVALETECFVPLKNGQTYNNSYHFLIRFRNGQACYVKEYFDTAYAQKVLQLGSGKKR